MTSAGIMQFKLRLPAKTMRVSKTSINPYLQRELFKTLHQTIADLKTPQEVAKFLKAFLSPAEHLALAKRLAIVYWLDKGRGYANIKTNLRVSSATISTFQNNLKNPGIILALKKIKAEEWANLWAERIQKLIKRGKSK